MTQEAIVNRNDPAYASQAVYTSFVLKAYGFVVYKFTGPVLWRCTQKQLLEFYGEQVSARHLDVGVATATLIDRAKFPVPEPDITLMDLNQNSLAFAAEWLRRYSPRTHQANVLEPWGLPPQRFESVGMMNILHCVPGTIEEKAAAFDHAREVLIPGGTLFGATVLGKGVTHTWLSNFAMRRLNRKGVFFNLDDGLEDLEAALAARFSSHQVRVQGTIALFTAKSA
ncbi:MAG TPA: class I SAM-dependent methyltransferase [Solirubrobacterales bacterium]|nr:class I SAM-dependent methyltransferase [Solirubrobacterales bacterium]